VAQLTASLGPPPHRASSSAAAGTATTDKRSPEEPSSRPRFDPLKHLPPIIDLPDLLRSEPARARADLLWGTWEPALRSWDEAGVRGVSELVDECREILREKRLTGQQLQARSRSQSIVAK
jgi:vacuolar protein sorting-associated protein 51